MKPMRWLCVAIVATALIASGCGKDAGPTTGPAGLKTSVISNDLGKLVPQDAVAMLYVASPDDFQTKLRALISEFDEGAAAEVDITQIGAQMLPGASQFWDRSKAFAIAVSLPPGGGDPMEAVVSGQGLTMVFPMTDVESAKTGMEAQFNAAPPDQRPQVRTSGSYLAFSGSPTTEWGDSAPEIAKRVPAGDIALRINLGALVTKFRKEIDGMLEGMDEMFAEMPAAPGQDMEALGGMLEGMTGWVKDFINSAEMFELGAGLDGGAADILVGFTAKKGSKLDIAATDSGNLAAIAAHLPDGFPVHLLMRIEYGKLMQWMQPLMDSAFSEMPEETRKQWKAYMDKAMDLGKLLGPNFAMAFAMGDNGMQMVQVADVKDAEAYKARMTELLESSSEMPGFAISKGQGTMISGIQVDEYDIKLDMKSLMESMGGQAGQMPPEAEEIFDKIMPRLFGGETLKMHLAFVGGHVLTTMGDTAHMESMITSLSKGKGSASASLAKAIAKAGGKPTFLVEAELRSLIGQIMRFAGDLAKDMAPGETVPQVPEGKPIPAVIWGAHEGRHYAGGLSIDVVGIAELVKAMSK